MRVAFAAVGAVRWIGRLVICTAVLACLTLAAVARAQAADAAASPPAMDNAMSSAGWLQQAFIRLEHEATSDASMLPDTPSALDREWRTFDRNGSPIGALRDLAWILLAGAVALWAERGVARGLGRRVRRTLRLCSEAPSLGQLMWLLLCDIAGLAVFGAVFIYSRHWAMASGATVNLILLAAFVAIRWRLISLIPRVVLRPHDPAARLIDVSDDEARRLSRFLSVMLLAVVALIGFGRYGLADEDSGANHIIGLAVAGMVCGLNALIVVRSHAAVEALLRGSRTGGVVAALRDALARAWLVIGLALVVSLLLSFVFGLSLGLLSYFHASVSTLGVLIALLVFERLTERAWHSAPAIAGRAGGVERLLGHSLQRILYAVVLFGAATTLAWIWVDAIDMNTASAAPAMRAAAAAAATLFVAYITWELVRLAVDRHLTNVSAGPKMPGVADDDEEAAPGSRLQTVLPMLRFMIGALIAVVATLVVLSGLGIDTAPLIAGAGVFGLAISFGSQSLVRDIISGLFYMWDDAFRIGEYIDTGRLKGAVEALGVRSVKVRHHNGPLHTIPYGQLGAVTNMSRDFATVKFNLRLEPGTDIEQVRKAAKRIGIEMQEEPEIAAEVILPLKMQGIAEVADTAVVVRFKFTARPVKPSWVQREYLKRIYQVFGEQRIRFASGALTLQTLSPPDMALARSAAAAPTPGGPIEELAGVSRPATPQTQPA